MTAVRPTYPVPIEAATPAERERWKRGRTSERIRRFGRRPAGPQRGRPPPTSKRRTVEAPPRTPQQPRRQSKREQPRGSRHLAEGPSRGRRGRRPTPAGARLRAVPGACERRGDASSTRGASPVHLDDEAAGQLEVAETLRKHSTCALCVVRFMIVLKTTYVTENLPLDRRIRELPDRDPDLLATRLRTQPRRSCPIDGSASLPISSCVRTYYRLLGLSGYVFSSIVIASWLGVDGVTRYVVAPLIGVPTLALLSGLVARAIGSGPRRELVFGPLARRPPDRPFIYPSFRRYAIGMFVSACFVVPMLVFLPGRWKALAPLAFFIAALIDEVVLLRHPSPGKPAPQPRPGHLVFPALFFGVLSALLLVLVSIR